ncbi:MAG: GHKL domain-containing protein, partial [Clostridiales bacterium]|nr:GHKL domain-containing protein [Clostridiales bacterium]
ATGQATTLPAVTPAPGQASQTVQQDSANSPPPAPDQSVSFTLYTDSDYVISSSSSILELTDEMKNSALSTALNNGKTSGSFTLDGTSWAFMKASAFDGYKFVFLDISSQQAILKNLIYTFLIVFLVMLVAIYMISRFFANKAIRPVSEAFDKQKQFIADASHELKTPLAVINTNVDVLLSNSDETISSQSKWLQYIKSESERMSRLTNDLLYLTQIDNAEKELIFTGFNISETVENIVMTMEAVIFEHDISFSYTIEPGLRVYGSSEQISQVSMILLDNAIKYTNPSGKVSISLKKHQGCVSLSVSNTGEGIAAEHLGRIFDRFYRTDKSRSRKNGGYGLGLAIAKAIVEQHSGKISVKSSEEEKLTTFTVDLPAFSD